MMFHAVLAGLIATSHPGGLNAEGCHNNRRTGDYHCHRGGSRPAREVSARSGGAFRNCAAAGAGPVCAVGPGAWAPSSIGTPTGSVEC